MSSLNVNMTRRQVIAAGLGVFASLGLAACGSSSSSSTSSATTASDSGTIDPDTLKTFVVGFDQNFPPYGYVGDDGEFTGFDIELAQECCKRNGWECQLEPIDWDAKDALINAGEITCIWNGLTIEGREDAYTFSEPYDAGGQTIVVRKDSGITSFDDLAGKIVQVQTDSTALHILTTDYQDLVASFAALEEIADYNTIFMNLEAGACDAIGCATTAWACQDNAKPDTFVMIGDRLNSEHSGVGFKKGETALAERVTETLKAMTEDGFVEQLCLKYADQGITFDTWCL